MRALSLNRVNHFDQSPDRHVIARAPKPQDALDPELTRSVTKQTCAVLGRPNALHVREGHWLAVNKDGGVVKCCCRGRDVSLLHRAVLTAHPFGGRNPEEVVTAPVVVTIGPDRFGSRKLSGSGNASIDGPLRNAQHADDAWHARLQLPLSGAACSFLQHAHGDATWRQHGGGRRSSDRNHDGGGGRADGGRDSAGGRAHWDRDGGGGRADGVRDGGGGRADRDRDDGGGRAYGVRDGGGGSGDRADGYRDCGGCLADGERARAGGRVRPGLDGAAVGACNGDWDSRFPSQRRFRRAEIVSGGLWDAGAGRFVRGGSRGDRDRSRFCFWAVFDHSANDVSPSRSRIPSYTPAHISDDAIHFGRASDPAGSGASGASHWPSSCSHHVGSCDSFTDPDCGCPLGSRLARGKPVCPLSTRPPRPSIRQRLRRRQRHHSGGLSSCTPRRCP